MMYLSINTFGVRINAVIILLSVWYTDRLVIARTGLDVKVEVIHCSTVCDLPPICV
jgi:hypothetical protein